jgi:DNA-directed RNA polymerase specialized sigma24 family protein
MAEAFAPFRWPQDWEAALPAIERRVRAVCVRYRLAAADAEEVYQQVRLKVWLATFTPPAATKELRDFPTAEALAAWAGCVALSAATRRSKKAAGRRQVDEFDPVAIPAPAGARDLDEYIELLDDAMEREAVRLRFAEGCSFAEMQERMGVSVGKAHLLVQTAVQRLRRRLNGVDSRPLSR